MKLKHSIMVYYDSGANSIKPILTPNLDQDTTLVYSTFYGINTQIDEALVTVPFFDDVKTEDSRIYACPSVEIFVEFRRTNMIFLKKKSRGSSLKDIFNLRKTIRHSLEVNPSLASNYLDLLKLIIINIEQIDKNILSVIFSSTHLHTSFSSLIIKEIKRFVLESSSSNKRNQ